MEGRGGGVVKSFAAYSQLSLYHSQVITAVEVNMFVTTVINSFNLVIRIRQNEDITAM